MNKTPAGIALGEVQTAIAEIDTVAAIMGIVGRYAPQEELQPEWFEFLARSIEQITERVEEVIGRAA